MLLFILCLRHLLFPARVKTVHHEDPNKEHDAEYNHAHFLADASSWRRIRMQFQPRRRFHRLFRIAHGFSPVSAPLAAAWAWGICTGAFPPLTPAWRINSTFV